jgi:hypothetical protein
MMRNTPIDSRTIFHKVNHTTFVLDFHIIVRQLTLNFPAINSFLPDQDAIQFLRESTGTSF